MVELEGLGAVVTGASSGVGCAIARALAAKGVTVCLVGRNREALERVSAETGSGIVCRADLTVDADVQAVVSVAGDELPGVDVLVHCAGIIEGDEMATASAADFDRQYRVNLRAPYVLTQALLPMLVQRRGQVVFVNSTAGSTAGPGSGQYAATKHGLRAVADSLRAEINADGVRVLSIMLGRTATPMQAALAAREGREYRPELLVQPEDVASVVSSALTLPRTAEITELAIRPMVKS